MSLKIYWCKLCDRTLLSMCGKPYKHSGFCLRYNFHYKINTPTIIPPMSKHLATAGRKKKRLPFNRKKALAEPGPGRGSQVTSWGVKAKRREWDRTKTSVLLMNGSWVTIKITKSRITRILRIEVTSYQNASTMLKQNSFNFEMKSAFDERKNWHYTDKKELSCLLHDGSWAHMACSKPTFGSAVNAGNTSSRWVISKVWPVIRSQMSQKGIKDRNHIYVIYF